MKKIALVLGVFLITQCAISQSKFRFGLKAAPSINWLKPDDVKKFSNGGSTLGFNWGLTGEYALSENFSFYGGLELNHEKGKVGFTVPAYYFMKENYELVRTQESGGNYIPEDTSAFTMKLANRTYKSTYVTLPFGIKMKTAEIGYMTYFGEFGLNLAFRTGTKIDDESTLVDVRASATDAGDYNNPTDINYDKDMQPIRVQLRVGLGAEYKISEGTSLFGGFHYNLGFTNVVKGDSRFLVDDNAKETSQKFSAHGLQLTVGVLF